MADDLYTRPHRFILAAGTLIIFTAPSVFGCYQPWAGGFLVAGVCALTAAHVVCCAISGQECIVLPDGLSLCAGLFCAWLIVVALVHHSSAQSALTDLRTLAYAGAFAGAAVLGASVSRQNGLRRPLRYAALAGMLLGILALLQSAGFDLSFILSSVGGRPSSVYINPNRFAVFLAICWACALGIFVETLYDRRQNNARRAALLAVSFLSLLTTGAAIGLTLSRLTIIALGASVAIVAAGWQAVHSRVADPDEEFELSPIDRLQRAVWLALPLVAMAAWGVWSFMVSAAALSDRMQELNTADPSIGFRFKAVGTAWPLLRSAPLLGHGLGSFEYVFTSIQPITLQGRWRQLHNDWLQLGIEAGMPALLLALALTAVWARTCWNQIKRDVDAPGAKVRNVYLRLFPMAGIATALFSSAGDFPLREPATAMIFFFLAGALAAVHTPALPRPSETRSRWRIAWPVAVAAMLALAFVAGRNAWACAQSPWMGQILYPPDVGKDPTRWQRAIEIDPTDPELRFNFALAAQNNWTPGAPLLEKALEQAQTAAVLNPRDHRFPWLAGALAERAEHFDEAIALKEKALALFPNNPALREQLGRSILRCRVATRRQGDPDRSEALEAALQHFRLALLGGTDREVSIIDALSTAGCLNTEIAQLWPGTSTAERLRRTRFYIDAGQLDMADREIPDEPPPAGLDLMWYDAVSGTLDLRRGEYAKGMQFWKHALEIHSEIRSDDPELERLIMVEADTGPLAINEMLAGELVSNAVKYPQLTYHVASTLINKGRWVKADQLLSTAAGGSCDLMAMWAELALSLGDYSAASTRAYSAWQMGMGKGTWVQWYDQFLDRLKQRQSQVKHSRT